MCVAVSLCGEKSWQAYPLEKTGPICKGERPTWHHGENISERFQRYFADSRRVEFDQCVTTLTSQPPLCSDALTPSLQQASKTSGSMFSKSTSRAPSRRLSEAYLFSSKFLIGLRHSGIHMRSKRRSGGGGRARPPFSPDTPCVARQKSYSKNSYETNKGLGASMTGCGWDDGDLEGRGREGEGGVLFL